MKTLITIVLTLASLANSAFAQEEVEASLVKDAVHWLLDHPKTTIGACTAVGAGAAGIDAISKSLEKGEEAYVLAYKLEPSSIKWAHLIGWPNIFPVLQVEGMESQYVVPDISWNYKGGMNIWTFKIPGISAGRSISIHIQDYSGSKELWDNFISTPVTFNLGAGVTPFKGIEVQGSISGTLKLMDKPDQSMESTSLGSCVIKCPGTLERFIKGPFQSENTKWQKEGSLVDSSGKEIGTVVFSQILINR